jgi:murein DD-endopeptidase MepM/ murein hydrolase activator NlpD
MIGAVVALACLLPPAEGTVVDSFREPPCAYCPGNRGIEYELPAGSTVVASAPGVVSFAGTVAGVSYVVIDHGDGWRTTYGKLADVRVRGGQRLRQGQELGRSSDQLFFGLRSGERYVDPGRLLGVVRHRPRLVPLDGTSRRPTLARLRCPAGGAGPPGR